MKSLHEKCLIEMKSPLDPRAIAMILIYKRYSGTVRMLRRLGFIMKLFQRLDIYNKWIFH